MRGNNRHQVVRNREYSERTWDAHVIHFLYNDKEKNERWKETIQWANENNCTQIIDSLSDNNY